MDQNIIYNHNKYTMTNERRALVSIFHSRYFVIFLQPQKIHAFLYSYEVNVARPLFDTLLPYKDMFKCSTAVLNLENKNKLRFRFGISVKFSTENFYKQA